MTVKVLFLSPMKLFLYFLIFLCKYCLWTRIFFINFCMNKIFFNPRFLEFKVSQLRIWVDWKTLLSKSLMPKRHLIYGSKREFWTEITELIDCDETASSTQVRSLPSSVLISIAFELDQTNNLNDWKVLSKTEKFSRL